MEVPHEIRFRYLQRRKRDLTECLASLEKEDFKEIEKVGHQLKGNAVTFGHPELSTIGKHLEKAAANKDFDQVEELLDELSHWLRQTKVN